VISAVGKKEASPLLVGNKCDDKHLLVVCTGDRGLCGSFNAVIVREVQAYLQDLGSKNKLVKVVCIGSKGASILKRRLLPDVIVKFMPLETVRDLGFGYANDIAMMILDLFERSEVGGVSLLYPRFQSLVQQVPMVQDIVPWGLPDPSKDVDMDVYPYKVIHDEEDTKSVLTRLLLHNVSVQIFSAMLETVASFYGAQLVAMDGATRNADNMVKKMTLEYNRARQFAVTQELIEVIGGAEVVLQ